MKKIIVFVIACVLAVGLLYLRDVHNVVEDFAENGGIMGGMNADFFVDDDFVDTTVKLIPDETDDGEIVRGEYYYTVDDVAYYLAAYGELPENYITKKEAETFGWISSEGNLWDVAPGAVIGGDRFGNYEKLLPEGGDYTECDVNYYGGYRGGERLVFDTEGNIWYTADHYETFEPLYPQ